MVVEASCDGGGKGAEGGAGGEAGGREGAGAGAGGRLGDEVIKMEPGLVWPPIGLPFLPPKTEIKVNLN